MRLAASRSHPIETGGVLIGVHLQGHPWIVTAIEIATDDRGASHFKIPAGATQKAVKGARAADPRLGYVGDWHSHPRDVGPSTTDLTTLGLISIKHPQEPNPALVILRRREVGYRLDARRVTALRARRCDIHLVGDLPTTTRTSAP
jgi:proteasome lid subunit RPN8/RPN11